MVKRGDVWLARLDPTEGREIRKTRPCVIISPPEIHDYLDIVLVAPMTTGSRPAGYRIPIHFSGKDGLILLDQIRTMDQKRLIRRLGSWNLTFCGRPLTLFKTCSHHDKTRRYKINRLRSAFFARSPTFFFT